MTNIQNNENNSIPSYPLFYISSFKSVNELYEHSKNLLPLKKVFGNYILQNNLVHFPSERGSGKTLFAICLCIAIASQWYEYCGEKIETHGNTLLVNYEMGEDLISRRIGKIYENPPQPIDQSKYQAFVYTTRLSFEEEAENIIELIKKYKPVLIVLDNFRMAFSNTDSNNNKDAAKAMRDILLFKDTIGAAILLTDHTRKHTKTLLTDSDLQSGAGQKSDLVDSDMFLRRSSQNKHFRILKRVKSRNCEEADGAKLISLNPETLWFELEQEVVNEEDHLGNGLQIKDEEEQREIAKELREKGKSYEDVARLLSLSKSKVYRWFNK